MAYWLRQVRQGCLQACHYFKGLFKGAQGLLEQEVALLHIQANLVSIAETIPGTPGTRDALAQAKGMPMHLMAMMWQCITATILIHSANVQITMTSLRTACCSICPTKSNVVLHMRLDN